LRFDHNTCVLMENEGNMFSTTWVTSRAVRVSWRQHQSVRKPPKAGVIFCLVRCFPACVVCFQYGCETDHLGKSSIFDGYRRSVFYVRTAIAYMQLKKGNQKSDITKSKTCISILWHYAFKYFEKLLRAAAVSLALVRVAIFRVEVVLLAIVLGAIVYGRSVVLNRGHESRMLLPGIFCAAFQQSFNKTSKIMCDRLRSTIKQIVSIDLC